MEAINIEGLATWIPAYSHPLVISGPCSAESEEQVYETAAGVSRTGRVSIFRAGIWKPRTRPNSFEGRGTAALPWLVNAARTNGLLSATEVANVHHVEECLRAGVDILWLGARTTVNPFLVQEIADALRGVSIPVFVKNPVNPDLQLWMGAIERISNAGITRLAAIHRGFSVFGNSPYRNPPHWEIAIELKRRMPGLDVICDPSHIGGKSELIAPLSQKALDLEMSGLMIEVHPHPAEALSDARQQITPAELDKLLSGLVIRDPEPGLESGELARLRQEIDLIDDGILERIASRMNLVEKIGAYKKENNITILQMDRWRFVIMRWLENGRNSGLEEEFILRLLQAIHTESIRRQTEANG